MRTDPNQPVQSKAGPAPTVAPGPHHFSSVDDIDEFIDMLARYEAGEVESDEFRSYRLTRGVYGQRQPGVQMIRIKSPGGVLTAEQLEALASVSTDFSRGFGHVTTRQAIQFHFVAIDRAAEMMSRLAAVGLTTREACGNTVRNVTADPLAGVQRDEPFDVTPYVYAVTRHQLRDPRYGKLPRKFKVAFSGNDSDRAVGAINDVGFVARLRDDRPGFKVVVGGGLSTSPQDAWLLEEWIPGEDAPLVTQAIVDVFNRVGNRKNRARARLKYAIRKLGFEAFEADYRETLARVRAEHPDGVDVDLSVAQSLEPPPAPRARARSVDPADRAAFETWRSTNVVPQKVDGYAAVLVRLALGDIDATQFRVLARLARSFGDGTIRTSVNQNLFFRWIPESHLYSLWQSLTAAELGGAYADSIVDVTSCPGADSCNLAYTGSRDLARELVQIMEANEHRSSLQAALDGNIKISGCPNSCGQHHIAAIGFHGGIRRVGKRVLPLYELHLGGKVGPDGARFGRRGGKVPARRAGEALLALLDLYEARRDVGESVADFFWRVDLAEVDAVVAPLNEVPLDAPDALFRDLGSEDVFGVHRGEGECMV
jgi:sulfite reductase beta subunit-like hemoprotein